MAAGHGEPPLRRRGPAAVYAVLRRLSDPRVQHYFLGQGIATWTGPGRIPGNTDLDLKPRVCIPVRTHGILFAFLFLIDEGVEDWEIELAEIAADEIGGLMYRRLVLHGRARAYKSRSPATSSRPSRPIAQALSSDCEMRSCFWRSSRSWRR